MRRIGSQRPPTEAETDREFGVRLARYCARNPVALSRLEYQSDNATVTYHSDKPTGPTAGQSECAGQLRALRLQSSATCCQPRVGQGSRACANKEDVNARAFQSGAG